MTEATTLNSQRRRARRTALGLALVVVAFYAIFFLKHLL